TIDQVQTVARICRQCIENTLPDSSPRPAVEPIVRTRVRAVAFGQIAPRDPGPQHVKYCIYDPPVVRARTLPTLRHQRLENRPFLIAEIESHDPPPPAVNHDPCCFSVNYAGTDPKFRHVSLVAYIAGRFCQSALELAQKSTTLIRQRETGHTTLILIWV